MCVVRPTEREGGGCGEYKARGTGSDLRHAPDLTVDLMESERKRNSMKIQPRKVKIKTNLKASWGPFS